MATIADLNKNEAVDNNVVTDNVLNEQMKALEVPVENQQVAENVPVEEAVVEPKVETTEVKPEVKTDVTPPAPSTSDAEVLFAAETPEPTKFVTPEDAKDIRKEYFKKRAKETIRKASKPNLTFKALKDDNGKIVNYVMKLYSAPDENGKIKVLDRYVVSADIPKERLEEIYRVTRDRINKLDLKTLGTAEGRPATIASYVSDYMTFGPESIKYAVGAGAIIANPVVGGAAVVGTFGLDHFYDFIPTTEEVFQGADIAQRVGIFKGVKATFGDVETAKKVLQDGKINEYITDEKGNYKPLLLSDLADKFGRREDVPAKLLAINLAIEGVTFPGAFIAGLFANRKAWNEVGDIAVESEKLVRRELAERGITRAPTIYELSKTIRVKLKDLSQTRKEGGDKITRLSEPFSRFKRDQIYQMRKERPQWWGGAALAEGAYGGTAYLLDRSMEWHVGGGLNTAGAIVATFTSGGIYRALDNLARGIGIASTHIINPFIKPFGKFDVNTATNLAYKEYGGKEGFDQAVLQRAKKETGGVEPDEVDLSRVEKEMIQEFRGGLSLDGFAKVLRGDENLANLGLTSKEIKQGEKFIKSFSELSPLSQSRMLKFIDYSTKVVNDLRDLGIENPETSLGTLFNLNVLRGIEPDLFAFKAKRSSSFRTGMLAQAGLEDYFQQKQELAEQLDIVLQDVLSGINKKLTTGEGRAETIQTEVRYFVNELKLMQRTLADEAVDSADKLEDAINLEIDNFVLGNAAVDHSIRDLIASIKITSGQKKAIEFLEKYDAKRIEAAAEMNDIAKEAFNVNPIKAKSTNSKNIASIIIDQKNALKDAKDTLYTEANALDKVVNGNGFYFALKDKINRSASQDFRENIGDTQKALDNLFGEAAQDYFNVIKKEEGLTDTQFNDYLREVFKEAKMEPAEIEQAMKSESFILETLMEKDISIDGISKIPSFYLSAKDLRNIESGLNARMRLLKPQIKDLKAFQHFGLQDIKRSIDIEYKKLEDDPDIKLNREILNQANEANVKYYNALESNLLKKTWGTRGRYRPEPEYIGSHEYNLQPEKWADQIFSNPDDAAGVYRDIDTLFQGADPKLKAEFEEAINLHALTLVQKEIVEASPRDLEKLLAGKTINVPTDDVNVTDVIEVFQEPATIGTANLNKKMRIIDALEEASIDPVTKRKRFDFMEARDFDTRLQKAVDQSDTLAKDLVDAQTTMNKTKKVLKGKINNRIKFLKDEVLGGDLQKLSRYQADPQNLLIDLQSGVLKDVQDNIISLNNPKKLEKFNEAVHTLFVQGFMNRFASVGDLMIREGESRSVYNLSMESLEFLKSNKKIIKDLFGKRINIDDLVLLGENAALTSARKGVDTSLIDTPTKGLPQLTIGSYVGRTNAVAQGRTGLKYIGAEALVVQMKSNEMASIAGLLLNPKATEKIADIIKSGKPLSGSVNVPALVWLPQLMGESMALFENYLENKEYISQNPSKLYDQIPPIGAGGIIRERELLQQMQQNMGGN